MSPATCYTVLGVPVTASLDEIQSAYKKAIRRVHVQIALGSPAPVEELESVCAAYLALRERDGAERGPSLSDQRAGDATRHR
jgi:DnaJ-class molecular chaperone